MTNLKMNDKYTVKVLGSITKFEAGVIYRAMKEENIEVLKETVSWLYDEAKRYKEIAYAISDYNQDGIQYDRIYKAVAAILEEDYETAQWNLTNWEKSKISSSTKKSPFFKYQTSEDEE